MMRRIIATSLLIFCIVSGTATPVFAADEKIVVVVDKNYPPYMYGTEQHANGLYPGLIEAVFTRAGIVVEVQALPWEQALKEGAAGTAAVGGIYKNNARLEIYDYSEPLYEEQLAVYVKKGKAFQFSRLSDLQGKNIGLNQAWSYGEEFDSARNEYHFTVTEDSSNEQSFRNLVSGKTDCLIFDEVAASRIIHQENLGNDIEKLEKPAAVNYTYLVFAKRLNKHDLLDRFNHALVEIKNDGSYEQLIQDFITANGEK